MSTEKYDAIMLVSFGGPEGADDVMPFLENVLRGKGVPEERKREVARHYGAFGGVSPINPQNRALLAALEKELRDSGVSLPIYWGNRNWPPYITDVMREMKNAGVKNFLALVTSGFSCYSGCRQYREELTRAQQTIGEGAPQFGKIRVWYNHPDFIEVTKQHWRQAAARFPADRRADVLTLFTAHSIPGAMAKNSDYEIQLKEACALTAAAADIANWKLVYQSRSGPPHQPWLGPDIRDAIRELHAAGGRDLILLPIGFISDHMEVAYDLDHEVKAVCDNLGITMFRAATPGIHPTFIVMLRKLIQERLDPDFPKKFLGARGTNHDVCPMNCCLSGRPAHGNPPSPPR